MTTLTSYLKTKAYIDKNKLADELGIDERKIRKVITEMRGNHKDRVYFIPARIQGKPGVYKQINEASLEEIIDYKNAVMSHWKTMYFDTILPLISYLKKEEQKNLYAFRDIFSDMEEERKL